MIAYTGIETISNMAEEAQDEAKTIPAAIARVRLAVFAIYFTLPAVALSALPVRLEPANRRVPDAARPDRGAGRLRGRPDPRRRQGDRPRPAAGAGRALRRHPRGHDPLHRHQRRASSASRGWSTRWASTASCPTPAAPAPALPHAVDRHPALRRRRHRSSPCPGQAAFLGNLYAFGAMLSFTIAHVSVIRLRATQADFDRPYRGPGQPPHPRLRPAALRAWSAGWARAPRSSSSPCSTRRSGSSAPIWLALGIVDLRALPPPAGPGPDLDAQGRDPAAGRRPRGRVRLGARARRRGRPASTPSCWPPPAGSRPARQRGIHVLVTITVPNSLPITAPLEDAENDAQSIIEQARVEGGRRVTGPLGEGPRRAVGPAHHRGGGRHARGGRA